MNGPVTFVGLDNYKTLMQDDVFLLSLKNNLIIVILSVVGQIGIAIILATLMTSRFMKLNKILKTVICLQDLVSPGVIKVVWSLR